MVTRDSAFTAQGYPGRGFRASRSPHWNFIWPFMRRKECTTLNSSCLCMIVAKSKAAGTFVFNIKSSVH